MRDTLAAVLADCGKTAIVEPGLSTVPGGREGHRADIATFNVVGDGKLVELLDVCITSGYTGECKSSVLAGEAARRAHQGKLVTYKSVIAAKGALVLPVVFDTAGCPAPQGTVLQLIAALAPRYTPPEEAVSWAAPTAKVALVQRLAVAAVRAVVNAVIRLRSNGAAPGPHPRSGQLTKPTTQYAAGVATANNQLRVAKAAASGGRGRGAGGRGAGRGGRGRGGRGRGGAVTASAVTAAIRA